MKNSFEVYNPYEETIVGYATEHNVHDVKKIIERTNKSKIEWNSNERSVFLRKVRSNLENKKALFSSVVPSVFLNIKKKLKKHFKIRCYELKQTQYSQTIKIKVNKKQIGSDRIANAIGAYFKYKCNCIVLDFGTATTFDVINKGVYRGGIIAPGVNLSLNTLDITIFNHYNSSKLTFHQYLQFDV